MSSGQIVNVNVIPDTGAIRRGIVSAIDGEFGKLSTSRL